MLFDNGAGRPGAVGAEMLAGRISLVVDGNVVSQALVKVARADTPEVAAAPPPKPTPEPIKSRATGTR